MEMLERIKSYLISGGLFNPEFAEHDKVRDLIIDCREELLELIDQRTEFKERIAELERENARLKESAELWHNRYTEASQQHKDKVANNGAEIVGLEAELAAAQATIARKDEALHFAHEELRGWYEECTNEDYNSLLINEALAIPADRTALDAMLAEARKEGMQWQPIETAPEDGKCLVCCDTDDGPWVGRLDRDKKGRWIHEGEPTFCLSYYFQPVLWCPLPDEPSADAIRQAAERSE